LKGNWEWCLLEKTRKGEKKIGRTHPTSKEDRNGRGPRCLFVGRARGTLKKPEAKPSLSGFISKSGLKGQSIGEEDLGEGGNPSQVERLNRNTAEKSLLGGGTSIFFTQGGEISGGEERPERAPGEEIQKAGGSLAGR